MSKLETSVWLFFDFVGTLDSGLLKKIKLKESPVWHFQAKCTSIMC